MKTVYWGKGKRGEQCLSVLLESGFDVVLAVTHSADTETDFVAKAANSAGVEVYAPEDPNSMESQERLSHFF